MGVVFRPVLSGKRGIIVFHLTVPLTVYYVYLLFLGEMQILYSICGDPPLEGEFFL